VSVFRPFRCWRPVYAEAWWRVLSDESRDAMWVVRGMYEGRVKWDAGIASGERGNWFSLIRPHKANHLRIWILSFLVLSIVGVPADSLVPAKGSLVSKGSTRH